MVLLDPRDFVQEVFYESGADFFDTAFTISRKRFKDSLKRTRSDRKYAPIFERQGLALREIRSTAWHCAHDFCRHTNFDRSGRFPNGFRASDLL